MKVPKKIKAIPMRSSWAYGFNPTTININYNIEINNKQIRMDISKECSTTDGGALFSIFYLFFTGQNFNELIRKFDDYMNNENKKMKENDKGKILNIEEYIEIDKNWIRTLI